MSDALFEKNSGYYRKKNPIGKDADFITSPEISQVFGEILAAYILQIFSIKKSKISLVEMGAGKGTLFRDILISIQKLADKKIPQALDFLECATLHIIEISEFLKKIQQKNLSQFQINWHENLDEISDKKEIFFISNELFDCFAIDQFVKTDIGWCERLIEKKNEKLEFILAKFNLQIHQFVENLIGCEASQKAPFGAVFEYSKDARDFMEQLCKALKKKGGMAINIDYGYVKNDFANSLQAIKNHQKTNILENVAESDITALVDFLALDKIAQNYSLNRSLITQREFLIGLGIEERKKSLLLNKTDQEKEEINLAIDRLIGEDKMGELFKCHILWK